MPSEYAPPFLLQERFKAGPRDYHLYLSRCGSTRQEQIPDFAEPHKPRYYVLAGEYSKGVQLGGGVLSYGLGHLWHLDTRGRPWHGRPYRLTGPPEAPLHEEPGVLEQHTSTTVFETIKRVNAPEIAYRAGMPGNRGPERYGVWVGRLPWTRRHGYAPAWVWPRVQRCATHSLVRCSNTWHARAQRAARGARQSARWERNDG